MLPGVCRGIDSANEKLARNLRRQQAGCANGVHPLCADLLFSTKPLPRSLSNWLDPSPSRLTVPSGHWDGKDSTGPRQLSASRSSTEASKPSCVILTIALACNGLFDGGQLASSASEALHSFYWMQQLWGPLFLGVLRPRAELKPALRRGPASRAAESCFSGPFHALLGSFAAAARAHFSTPSRWEPQGWQWVIPVRLSTRPAVQCSCRISV